MKNIVELNDITDWKSFLKNKKADSETIIFKYSPICSISSAVENTFFDWFLGLSDEANINCLKINVINARPVSRKIADDLDIMHQSPQIIWLNGQGKVKWSESHYSITKSKLDENLQE